MPEYRHLYVVDPGGSLGGDVRAAIRSSAGATPLFVESMEPFINAEGRHVYNRRAFSFSPFRLAAPGVYTLDVFRSTSRFDAFGEQLLCRWSGSSWTAVDPAELWITVTTAVS
ncbi:MAG: hypothetical protein ACE5GC_00435 [Acidimicrobiia bacterium]